MCHYFKSVAFQTRCACVEDVPTHILVSVGMENPGP